VAVHLASSDRASLILTAQRGLPEAARGNLEIALATPGLSAWLSRFGQPVLSSDAGWPNQMPDEFRIPGYRSYLGTQLRAGGEVLGVLSCYREQGSFALNHVSVLSALAEQLGVVIENHRLRQQAEETAIVSERQRLARELHDSVTQSLYSQALFARAARNALEDWNPSQLGQSLAQLEANAASALREMRLLLHQLRPAALEAGGLAQAINDRLDLVERRVGIAAECRVDGRVEAGSDTEIMLYRVAMEALNNALRHANATRVEVSVRVRAGGARLTVSDNGCGFDPARASTGLGLAGMRERVRQAGGKFRITSAPGRGTTVKVTLGAREKTSPAQRRSHE
jgi:signal transduction histidine kinase